MPASVIAPPPRPRRSAPPRPPLRRERAGGGRVALVAGAASVLLHLLLFLLVRFEFVIEERPLQPPVRAVQLRPAMQAYDIRPIVVAPGQPEPLLPPPRLELPEREPLRPAVSTPAPASPTGTARAPSVAERLRRTPTDDLELWRPVAPGQYERPLTEEEKLRARLAARMNAYNDSVAGVNAARERATDWTITDEEGGRWGVSPGKVHLGGITLPLPVAFSTPAGRREDVAARTRGWTESQASGARAEADDNFKERVKAIRERRQAERDSAQVPEGR